MNLIAAWVWNEANGMGPKGIVIWNGMSRMARNGMARNGMAE